MRSVWARRWRGIWPALFCVLVAACPSAAIEFSVVSFNVDSGDHTAARQVAKDIANIAPSDLWGLQEVDGPGDLALLTAAIGPGYRSIIGTSGVYPGIADDNLAIVFNPDVFELIDASELNEIEGSRKPLVARFVLRQSGLKFLFMVNHLQRNRSWVRESQARYLNAWVQRQFLPVVAVGHYNFSWDLRHRQGDQAFGLLIKDEVFQWVPPDCLERGDCPPVGSRCDAAAPRFQDFVFVTGPAKYWHMECDLLFLDDPAYCERAHHGHSANRPLRAVVRISSAG
jgi:hypothetical protein